VGLWSILRGREDRVYSELETHLQIIVGLTESFKWAAEALRSGEYAKAKELYAVIEEGEKEADRIRRRIAEDICKGTFYGHLREDVLNLVEKIDDIGDWVRGVARIIADTPPQLELLVFVFSLPEMDRYVGSLVEIASKLLRAISKLKSEGVRVAPILHEIEDIEEYADDLKISLVKSVMGYAEKFRLIDVLEVRDMIYMLDDAIDSAEDASDIILQILAKSYA